MKYLGSMFVFLSIAFANAVSAAPERTGDFALLDQLGDFHQFSRYGHSEALVLYSQSLSCASSTDELDAFKTLKSEWESKNVAFLLINSAGDELGAIRQAAEAQQLELPVLLDDSQLVAKTLKITKAGEVVVLDPQTLTVLFRGPIGEDLSSQIQLAATGVAAETLEVDSDGCSLDMELCSSCQQRHPGLRN
jgi:peroxiredoxin